jgi:hypothetical protein
MWGVGSGVEVVEKEGNKSWGEGRVGVREAIELGGVLAEHARNGQAPDAEG